MTNINKAEILELYNRRVMTRRELRLKFGLNFYQLETLLKIQGIEVWDKTHKNKKKPNSKYFFLKDYKSHYFFSYNK